MLTAATAATVSAQYTSHGGIGELLLLAVAAVTILAVVLVLLHSERTLCFEKGLQRRTEASMKRVLSDLPEINEHTGNIQDALQSVPWVLEHAAGALLQKLHQHRSLFQDRDERVAAIEDAVEAQPGLRLVRRVTRFVAANILTAAVLLSAAEATRGLLEMAAGGPKQALLRAIATGCACNGVLLALSIWCSGISQRLEDAERAALRHAAQVTRELSRRVQRSTRAGASPPLQSPSPARAAHHARLGRHEPLKEPNNGSSSNKS